MDNTFTFESRLKVGTKTEADLKSIHQFADTSTSLDDYAILELRAIDDQPIQKNGVTLVVTPEWMRANLSKFTGIPFVRNHESDSRSKLGRTFATELRKDPDGSHAVYAKAFIAYGVGNDDDIDAIRKGRDLEVSLGFHAFKFAEAKLNGQDVVQIVPSNNPAEGPYEISSVGVPACKRCAITSIAATADDEPEAFELSDDDRECLKFGRKVKDSLISDIVSYERQLGFLTDIRLAKDDYNRFSPFFLQDRRDNLLKQLNSKEKENTQCSFDFDALIDQIEAEMEEHAGRKPRMKAADIAAAMKG